MSCTRGTVIALAANGSPYGGYSARGFKSLANQQIDQLRNGDTLKLDPAKFQGDASWRMSWSSEFGYKIFAVIGDTDDVDPTKQIMTFASDADLDAANKSDGITISAATAAVAAQVENAVANGNSDMVADEIARLQAEAEIARAEIARLRNAVEYQMDNDDNESVGGMSIARGSGPGMPPQSGMMPPQSGMMPAQSGMMMPPQSGMMMPAQSGMMQAQSGMMQAQSGMTHSVTTSQVDALAGSLSMMKLRSTLMRSVAKKAGSNTFAGSKGVILTDVVGFYGDAGAFTCEIESPYLSATSSASIGLGLMSSAAQDKGPKDVFSTLLKPFFKSKLSIIHRVFGRAYKEQDACNLCWANLDELKETNEWRTGLVSNFEAAMNKAKEIHIRQTTPVMSAPAPAPAPAAAPAIVAPASGRRVRALPPMVA